ncbi:mobile element protein (plasmid) [Geminocystis sp. NIES-3708]|uniref:Tn3 family transposase n=1 Tax=Geminocystis sp. NIES-3708 TaxID=1615909 RepID=UPI0005FCB732|nr:Tn3 family transposase [Geminocystis sp. NIES-3708]BAQ63191.1 mobile element protein [Geminocystis sp. NIES-3708]
MTSIERTAYPRFKRYYTTDELNKIYTPISEEKLFANNHSNNQTNYLNLLVNLKTFQRLGYFPKIDLIPLIIIKHLKEVLSLPEEIKIGYQNPRTYHRHRDLIRQKINVKQFEEIGKEYLAEKIRDKAYLMGNPADLINVGIEELVKERYELPSFSFLEREINRIRTQVHNLIYQQVYTQLSLEYIKILNDLLLIHPLEQRSPYNQLKQVTKKATRNHLNDLLVHQKWLETFGNIEQFLSGINNSLINYFVSQANCLDASELKDINEKKRLTLLLCLIYQKQIKTWDDLGEMFLKRMKKIHNLAELELQKQKEKQQEIIEKLIAAFGEILSIFGYENELKTNNYEQVFNQIYSLIKTYGGYEQLLEEYKTINAYKGNNYLPFIWRFYKSHRSAFFRLLNSLQLESTTINNRLMDAVNFLLINQSKKGEYLSAEVDISFASQQWQKLVFYEHQSGTKFVRRYFEVCVFSYLAWELKSGDICIKGSSEYADWRKQLLSWNECQIILDKYCQDLELPNTAESLVNTLKNSLSKTGEKVDFKYPQNATLIINEQGEPLLKKVTKNEVSRELKNLEAIITERMPNYNLIDILKNVDYWTNFTRHFTPISGSDPKIENPTQRYLLTTFTYGCNLEPNQASKHMKDVISARLISFIHHHHISTNSLNKAINDVINRYNILDLPKLWGKGNVAAADGTKFDVREQNLLSEYHIRYGGYGGIAYHHVADKYIALFSHFIPCGTWEAVYIIEGLLKNKSDLQPEFIHADTQGQSTPVFALSYLLGIKLMPRIRNWQDLVFYRPDKSVIYSHIDSLFKDTINWQLIETHFQDLMQVVLSIYTGKISSVTLLRKLGNYSLKNRLYKAFRELGRVIRTIFLLEYISDLKLRQQITATTNKVEAYNGFSKWLFFGGEQIITTNDIEEMEKRIKYNDLVANAVIFHNVVELTNILQQLQKEGYFMDQKDVVFLSPYLTSHIKRFGDYFLDLNEVPQSLDEFAVLSFNEK